MKVFLSVIILAIAIAPVYAALGDQQIVKEYTPGYGWTHIVPMKSNCGGWTDHDLFSYNAATGHVMVSEGVDSYGDQIPRKDYMAAQGWTHIVPMNVDGNSPTDFLFYNAATGHTIVSIGPC